jgi:3-hydroxyisobutyrate dehydrogenase-like beta-hydroxyacid dehydrogenase
MANLAFIGTGIMGLPMAGHLLRGGNNLVLHTRTKSKAQPLLDAGATWSASAKEAAQQADVVFLCLPDTPDVQAAITGPGGIIEAARPGLIVVDHSTISPAATREMSQALLANGTHLLDAPISGGDVGAKNATLSIMVGGDASAFERVKPLLALMGKTILHAGPSGSGQLTKLVNQILVSNTLLAVCEALLFAEKSGLDPQKTLAAVSAGAAGSWQLSNLGPKIASRDYAPGFMIDLMQKDLRLVMQSAQSSLTPLPATSLVHQLFSSAQAGKQGKAGTQALYTVLEKLGHSA